VLDAKRQRLKELLENPCYHIVSGILATHCVRIAKMISASDRSLITNDNIVELFMETGELLLKSISQEHVLPDKPSDLVLSVKEVWV